MFNVLAAMPRRAHLGLMRTHLLLTLALSFACHSQHGGTDETVAPDAAAVPADAALAVDFATADAGPGPIDETVGPAPVERLECAGDGTYDVAVSATGLEEYEGATVYIAAYQLAGEDEPARRVLLRTAVADGAFAADCAASITTNFAYPSVAVLLDLDDDGCNDGDPVVSHQLFGWDEDVGLTLTEPGEFTPLDQSRVSVIGHEESFCEVLFD